MMQLHLVPQPKKMKMGKGVFVWPQMGWIVLEPYPTAEDTFAADRLRLQMEEATGTMWKIVRGERGAKAGAEIYCCHDEGVKHEQGYRLNITAKGIELRARTAAGMFYAMQTLAQIVREASREAEVVKGEVVMKVPALSIDDEPDFVRRGVYHDTARGKVPQLDTILQLVDDLASLKINEFQLYVENAYEFRRHPEMYDDTTPLTAEDLLVIDLACRRRHIDFVPSLTSLGHFEKILSRPSFAHLAEAKPAELRAIGAPCWVDLPWSLCVSDPRSKVFLKDMYDEFLPNFSSKNFNICCDEAYDLGRVRSKKLVEKYGGGEKGAGELYVQWVDYCNKLSKAHGKRIMMWGDIIRNHPDLIARLPKDATMIEWGYEAGHDFMEKCKVFAEFAKKGGKFYVAPGTSTWLTLGGRTKNAFINMYDAARAGMKYGAVGFLNTDWGDLGHQQLLAVSMLPFAYGAAVAWNGKGTPDLESKAGQKELAGFLEGVSLHVFADPDVRIAELAYELGLTYERLGWQRFNASADWWLFREKWADVGYVHNCKAGDLMKTRKAVEKLLPQLDEAELYRLDGDLIVAELVCTAREILHAIDRTLLRQKALKQPEEKLPKKELKRLIGEIKELGEEFETLWLARNKASRLEDVMREFGRVEKEYKKAMTKAK